MNASTLGLILTGSLMEVDPDAKNDPGSYFKRMAGRMGEPVIRTATRQAMRILGEQFVLGRSISAAIKRGRGWKFPEGAKPLFSFDMLGEGARTEKDAQRYQQRYMDAIEVVAKHRQDGPITEADGVSVKLSALYPQYHAYKEDEVMESLEGERSRKSKISSRRRRRHHAAAQGDQVAVPEVVLDERRTEEGRKKEEEAGGRRRDKRSGRRTRPEPLPPQVQINTRIL